MLIIKSSHQITHHTINCWIHFSQKGTKIPCILNINTVSCRLINYSSDAKNLNSQHNINLARGGSENRGEGGGIISPFVDKIQIFWEGHKNLKKSPSLFWHCQVIFKKERNLFKFCGLLKVSWFRNAFLVSSISSKKRTKTRRIVVRIHSFVFWKNPRLDNLLLILIDL